MDAAISRQKVLIADAQYAVALPDVIAAFPGLDLLCVDGQTSALDLATADVTGLITQSTSVDTVLLDALPGLQAIVKNGRSYHNVDVETARARGLTIASVPRKGPNCVAELAMTLILALSKDLLIAHESVAQGAYRLRGLQPEKTAERKIAFHWMKHATAHEVYGKTLGILGMGEIGCELARRADVMGMQVCYHKRSRLSDELETRFNATYTEFDAMLQQSDYICVALPHTDETERLLGQAELAMMKPTAYVVNIARGGIIDEEALIEALARGTIAGAGLDVFTYEPLPADSPLCDLDNVIMTPHIGGGTGTTRPAELSVALSELERILAGGAPQIDLRG